MGRVLPSPPSHPQHTTSRHRQEKPAMSTHPLTPSNSSNDTHLSPSARLANSHEEEEEEVMDVLTQRGEHASGEFVSDQKRNGEGGGAHGKGKEEGEGQEGEDGGQRVKVDWDGKLESEVRPTPHPSLSARGRERDERLTLCAFLMMGGLDEPARHGTFRRSAGRTAVCSVGSSQEFVPFLPPPSLSTLVV